MESEADGTWISLRNIYLYIHIFLFKQIWKLGHWNSVIAPALGGWFAGAALGGGRPIAGAIAGAIARRLG